MFPEIRASKERRGWYLMEAIFADTIYTLTAEYIRDMLFMRMD